MKKNSTSPLIQKQQIKAKQLTRSEKLPGIIVEGVGGKFYLSTASRNYNIIEISRRQV